MTLILKELSHSMTPIELRVLNENIQALLESDETNTKDLSDLVDKRHELILDILSKLSDSDKRSFAEAEMPINEYLRTFAGAMLKESSNTLHNLSKGKKAVNKYKQSL